MTTNAIIVAAPGTVVSMHYKVTKENGEVIDTTEGQPPLEYLHGAGNIVEGLEQALAGKRPGDRVQVSVPPELGYGVREEDGTREVPRSSLPRQRALNAGTPITAHGPRGEPLHFWIVKADEETVTLDSNHPLAGETLHFDVTIHSVRRATRAEVDHGHAHSPGGHHHH